MFGLRTWLNDRESGMICPSNERNSLMNRVYKTLAPFHHWNDISDLPVKTSEVGAVFNLEFSLDGNILIGACEKKTITLYDSITTKEFHRIPNAHTDYVNCVKFLDNRMFATCSDDTTVALWDLRQLKSKVRSLHGHSNWVKNIEYSRKNNLLVTSGFDGSIFTWDINSHTEQGLIYQKVFHTSGLMRCRITPDGEKMIICTTGGYIMIIHNLDLTSLHKDLCGFRPGIYRLMQMGQQYIPQAAKFDHVFSKQQKKNRVELVTDFPEDNDAEVILALEIHPHGHSFLSRNISHDEFSEWSCIHNLNEEPEEKPKRKRKINRESDEDSFGEEAELISNRDSLVFSINRRLFDRSNVGRSAFTPPTPPPPPPQPPVQSGQSVPNRIVPSRNNATNSSQSGSNNQNQRPATTGHRQENFVPDIWAAEVTVQERAMRQSRTRGSNSTTGYNFVYAISSGVLPAISVATTRSQGTMTTPNIASTTSSNSQQSTIRNSATPPPPNETASSSTDSSVSERPTNTNTASLQNLSTPALSNECARTRTVKPSSSKPSRHIIQNPKKLLYFIQESNSGKGFIKEPCFSRDGRVICSPYDNGVRLLGFSEGCSEFPQRLTSCENPKELVEIQTISAHSDIVFSTKFSPRESLLVSGCRSGKVVWYYPRL